jgi:hypothetical protein
MEKRIVNLKYGQLDVFGMGVPSEELFGSVVDNLENEEDIHKFNSLHNEFMNDFIAIFIPNNYPYNGENIETKLLLELYSRLRQNYKEQCEMMSLDFSLLWQSFAVIRWLKFTIGESTTGDMKQVIDETSKLHQARSGKISRDSFKVHDLKYHPSLEKYPEYIKAMSVYDLFEYKAGFTAIINCDMDELRIEEVEILNRIAKIGKHRRIDHYSFVCYFCNRLVTVTSEGTFKSDGSMITKRRMHKNCGSKECDADYSATTTDKNKKSPSAVQKQGFKSIIKSLEKAFDGKRRTCECKHRRVLKKFRGLNLCEVCIDEMLSG